MTAIRKHLTDFVAVAGLVVATLGRRPEYLAQTLASIRAQEVAADVVMVAPEGDPGVRAAAEEFGAAVELVTHQIGPELGGGIRPCRQVPQPVGAAPPTRSATVLSSDGFCTRKAAPSPLTNCPSIKPV